MKRIHLLLIILSLICIICGIWSYIKRPDTDKTIEEKPIVTVLEEVNDRNNYYMVENCVNKFYLYYMSVFENKNPEDEDVRKAYNLLDKQYIKFNNITQENLHTILPKINESVATIYNMYVSQQNEYISVYLVNGNLREKETNKLSEFKIMVKIDLGNQTFSVLLQDYINAKYPNINVGGNLVVDSIENVMKNQDNYYLYEEILDKIHVLNLFERYKEEALYNVDKAFENLDEKYKNAKFGTVENFQKYIESHRKRYDYTKIEQYKKTQRDGYVEYICVDKDGYYYVFKETKLMKYTVLLDTYTTDLPEFLQKYNAANSMDKVGYNIQKVLDAINAKDYEYVYNKLYFEFKAFNYPTIESFKEDVELKMFNTNIVKEVASFNEGSIYAFKVTITDEEDSTKEQDMTIIMELQGGTEFVMSFSFSK